jgi:hypothetical protein
MRANDLRTVLFGPCALLATALLFLTLEACAVSTAARTAAPALGTLIERSACDPDPQVRRQAIALLAERSEVEVTGAMELALSDTESCVRAAAIEALRGRPAGKRLLERAADSDPDLHIRERAVELLAAR